VILPEPYWTDGQLTLYHGDAMEIMPLLKADAIVTEYFPANQLTDAPK
jgi:hypothetical protein